MPMALEPFKSSPGWCCPIKTQHGPFHSHDDLVRISVSKTEVSVGPHGNDSNGSSTNFRILAVRDMKLQWRLSENMYLSRDFEPFKTF